MTSVITAEFLLILAGLFVLAKSMGEAFERIQLPSLLGEIMAGVLLAPFLIGTGVEPVFVVLSEIGLILLLFVAGFEEVNIGEMLRNKKAAFLIGILGLVGPFAGVYFLAVYALNLTFMTSILLATALSATSVGIAIRTLIDINEINSKVGRTVVGALIIDDIVGLVLLTLVISMASLSAEDMGPELIKVVMGIIAFFGIFLVAEKIMPVMIRYSVRLRVEEAQFTMVFVVVLFSAYLAETMGLSIIIGAFFAGIALSHSSILETESFSQKLSSVSYGLFIPIFFAFTGAQIRFDNLAKVAQLALLLFGVVLSTQLLSAWLAARLSGFKDRDSMAIAAAIVPRGEIAMVIMASMLAIAGAANDVTKFGEMGTLNLLFSAVMIMIFLTIVITPILMRVILKGGDKIITKNHKAKGFYRDLLNI